MYAASSFVAFLGFYTGLSPPPLFLLVRTMNLTTPTLSANLHRHERTITGRPRQPFHLSRLHLQRRFCHRPHNRRHPRRPHRYVIRVPPNPYISHRSEQNSHKLGRRDEHHDTFDSPRRYTDLPLAAPTRHRRARSARASLRRVVRHVFGPHLRADGRVRRLYRCRASHGDVLHHPLARRACGPSHIRFYLPLLGRIHPRRDLCRSVFFLSPFPFEHPKCYCVRLGR